MAPIKSPADLKAYFAEIADDLGCSFEYGNSERILNRQLGDLTYPVLWLEVPQVRPIPVHRDANRDGIRPGDRVHTGLFGINQHGTRPGYNGSSVGNFSEGCLVGRDWTEHTQFIALCRSDKRWQQNKMYIFTSTVIAGDDLARGGVMAVSPTPPVRPDK